MKTNNNLLIARLKSNALKLRGTNQLPSYLVYLILHIDKDTKIVFVEFLKSTSEHLLRVRGYYKKYPSIEKQFNDELKKQVEKLAY